MALSLGATQLDRYSRHIIIDEVDPGGQGRLLSLRAVVVGTDGLGVPAIQYLTTVGVGELVVVDDDVVERSDFQWQVVHCDDDVGTPKAEGAAAFVRGLNPDVSVESIEARVDRLNVHEVVAGSDAVVDVLDNFPTRYLLDDVCCFKGTPLVHSAIYKFKRQATTLVLDGPCYQRPFPGAPEPGAVPDCATTGVLGVLSGTVGRIQATEAMKLLSDEDEVPNERLLFHGAMGMIFEMAPYRMSSGCPVCGGSGVDSIEDIDCIESCAISLG